MSTTNRHSADQVSVDALNAFNSMWGLYPAPVMLLKADREIVAINTVAEKMGIPIGIKCFQLSKKDKICEGCLGNEALKARTGKRVTAWQQELNMFVDTYWIPVQEANGLYVHFGNNITPYVKDELCG